MGGGVRAATQSSPTRSRKLAVLVVLGGLSAFGPLSIDMYLPALPRIAGDLSTSDTLVQITLTACLVGLALGQALAGPLSDTLGRRRPLLASLVVYAVASVLCAVAPSISLLIAMRLLQGLAGAAGIVIARAVIRDLREGPALARLFAMVMMINGLAPILAPVVGGQVLRFGSWRWVFVILAVLGALLLAAVVAWLPESLSPDRRHAGSIARTLRTFVSLARDRTFVGHLLTIGLSFGAMFAYISASPFVLQQLRDLTPQQFSLVFGANAVGLVVCSQLTGVLVGRVDPSRLLRLGVVLQVCGTVGVLLVVASGPLWGLLVALFVSVATIGLIMPNATALALADHGAHAGTASAMLGTVQFLVGALAPVLMGIGGMGQATGMGVVMTALAAASLVACFGLARARVAA
ncbi:multidrug effflux MFS transporter [Segeticoccus rhizosphaerae]|jgi:DHA1 family bicyclomycin/chloramphenicol resistance-like MFS transporter|uniref:multidrug effflux MFS transporter n=1 Tax=Segeticoccus rhizosphaerae TaxID=1104777 RepID=UPI0012643903|nr:multidrug effflux MFS transporter [Segeticoccus rhizosphaerae]